MQIVINDANILIDLIHLNMMDEFFKLEFNLKITDEVYDELNIDQKEIIYHYLNSKHLEIIVTEKEDDFRNITSILENNSGLSFADCSVWYYADKLNAILLTGDGKLRKQASLNGVSVKGILFVFDELLLNGLITFNYAIEKLEKLYQINPRLPIDPKNERIENWILKKHI